LVVDKVVSYSELEKLNFIDAMKISAILDFRLHKEKESHDKELKETKKMRNNGNRS